MPAVYLSSVADDVEIPDQGTLSKKLVDDRVRLVLFAFDRGQELTEHSTPRPVIIQIERGHLQISVEGDTFEARPGSWLSLEPSQTHSVLAIEPSVMLLTLLPT